MKKTIKMEKRPRAEMDHLPKPSCGTLNYIAECRGCIKRPEVRKWLGPGTNRIVRTYRSVAPLSHFRTGESAQERRVFFIV